MPTLSDKLKSLGVSLGTSKLPASTPRQKTEKNHVANLENLLDGHWITTTHGDAYLIETFYSNDYTHGTTRLIPPDSLDTLSIWAEEPQLAKTPPLAVAFIDTETTGLSGGTGTLAFLIGIGRFDTAGFQLAQFFLPDPAAEPAQLIAAENFLAGMTAIVTFNGKSFDLPLLRTRYALHGWPAPFSGYAHADLLHLARRLWRDRLPSRTLGNLETQIIGASRTEDDIPGWMIPQMYLDYLHTGDPAPLQRVIYHNAMDILSLAALFNHLSSLLDTPLESEITHGVDILSLARLFEDMGLIETATSLYIRGLNHPDTQTEDMPRSVYLDAIQRLASIHKKNDQRDKALLLWKLAANNDHLEAHIELAKFFEHQLRDYTLALEWTRTAIDLVNSPAFPNFSRSLYLPELEHRQSRLLRKLERARSIDNER